MKDLTFGNKMRWIAGALYGLLAVYQMYLVKPVLVAATPSNVYFTWIYAIWLMLGAAAMAVWMFHGRADLSPGVRRAAVTGTVFCVIFELMTYSDQTDLINYAVYSVMPDQVNNTTLLYVLMVLRLLLMILAAFFVTSSKQPDKKHLVPDEDGEADEVVVVETVEVIELDEPEAETGEAEAQAVEEAKEEEKAEDTEAADEAEDKDEEPEDKDEEPEDKDEEPEDKDEEPEEEKTEDDKD